MRGGQCEAVNYALQVITGLLNPNDDLIVNTMTVCGNITEYEYRRMSEEDFVKRLCSYDNFLDNKERAFQEIRKINCTYGNPFNAVDITMEMMEASPKEAKWLIFLTDGEWESDMERNDKKNLERFIEQTGTQVIFLNTDPNPADRSNNLDPTLRDIADVEPLQTQGKLDRIIDQMEQIGKTVMGIPGKGLDYTIDGNTVTISTPVPLKRLIVLDQERTSNSSSFPGVKEAKQNTETPLDITEDIMASNKQLSGRITHLEYANGKHVIPNGEITITFDAPIKGRNIQFFPEVAAKLVAYPTGDIKGSSGSIYTICEDEDGLVVEAKLLDLNDQPLANIDFKDCDVRLLSSGKKIKMDYDAGKKLFRAKLSLDDDETKFSVSAEYEGYFNFLSNLFTIRKDTCQKRSAGIKSEDPVLRGIVDRLDEVSPIIVYPIISDGPGQPKRSPTPEEFEDLDIEKVNKIRLGIKVKKKDDHWEVYPTTNMCACFTKTGEGELVLKMVSDNDRINADDELTVKVEIEDIGWWEKCGWLLIAGAIFLVFLWYLMGIFKKPRFAKGSEIVYYRSTRTSKRRPISYGLPTGFFNRYLIPYLPEKRNVEGLTFKAGKRGSYVFLTEGAQEENMYIGGSPIEYPGEKDARVSLGEEVMIVRKSYRENYQYNLVN